MNKSTSHSTFYELILLVELLSELVFLIAEDLDIKKEVAIKISIAAAKIRERAA